MSTHGYTALSWLTLDQLEDLAEAIRIAEARHETPTRDTCERCGGEQCDACRPDIKPVRR